MPDSRSWVAIAAAHPEEGASATAEACTSETLHGYNSWKYEYNIHENSTLKTE